MRGGLCLDHRPDDRIERRFVGETRRRRGEAFLVCQRGHVHQPAEALTVAVLDGEDRHPRVRRPEHATGHTARLHRAAFEMAGHEADGLQRGRGLHQADVDVASFRFVAARIERRTHRLKGIERGRHVDHDHRHAMGNPVLAAILRHHAGIGLQHRVHGRPLGQRPGLAEARDRHVEEARHAGRDGGIVETPPLDDARPEAFEKDIGVLQQAPHDVLPGLALEVDRQAALAHVADDREGAVAPVVDAERARPVALADALDLDHLGAVLGQQHGAIGAGDALAQVDDLEAGKGRVVAHASLTSILPKFSPRSRPMKARGALSIPSTMSSRYLSLPSRIHSPIWRIAGP